MGNPAYDARRAAEEMEAQRKLVEAEAGKVAMEAFRDLFLGRASILISSEQPYGRTIRIVRDRT